VPLVQSQIIPMYVYPADIAGESPGNQEWLHATSQARAGDGGPSKLIANVFNGAVNPGAIAPRPNDPQSADGFADPAVSTYAIRGSALRAPTIDPTYAAIIARCSPTTPVLGYVSTHYGAVPLGRAGHFDPATVIGQINLWFTLYPSIAGIFLDEVSSSPADGRAAYYLSASRAAKGIVVANVGAPPPTDWLLRDGVATTLVMFENAASTFTAFAMPDWTASYPPGAFAVIAHGATSVDEVRQIRHKSAQMNIGSLYVTDHSMAHGANPYRGLPSPPFWQALLGEC
jgi:hypothetical protein